MKGFIGIFKQRPIFIMLVFMVLYGLGSSVSSGLNMYFYTYIINDLALMGTVTAISVIGLLPGVALSRTMILKLGTKKVIILAALITAISLAVRLAAPASVPLIYITTVTSGFGLGFFAPVAPLLSAENIDYIEYKLHIRSEASMGTISTFASKLGSGVGGALPGYMLYLTGYNQELDVQPASVNTGIILMSLLVPAVLYLLGVVIFQKGYNVDFSQVSATLAERRAKLESE